MEPQARGIMVYVTLAQEFNGCGVGRLLYKIMRRKKVEQDLDTMLSQLKAFAESMNRNQNVKA